MQPLVAVLTALPLECRAVRSHLTNARSIEHETGTKALVGELPDSPWSVALLESGPNNLSAAALTEHVLSWLDPKAVLFVGVAGSLKDDIDVGDVVVATKVYGIHGGKETPEGFQTRPEMWHASNRLLEAARAALRDDEHVHLKPIASGEVVVASAGSALVKHLRKNYNDAAAIETEGAGVSAAVERVSGHLLIIRGISDRADAAKPRQDAAGSQPYAADKAAAAAMAVLRELRPFGGRSDSRSGSSAPEEGPPEPAEPTSTAEGTPRSTKASSPPAAAVLPAVPDTFIGRDDEVARVLAVLDPHTESRPPVRVCLLSGLGGIGKTSLASYAGRKAVEEKGWFPGGTLFIDFHGYGADSLSMDQALRTLLEGLGVGGADMPEKTSYRRTLYRQLLARQRPTLLVFDNVSRETQLAHLLPGTGHHRVLITSRYRITDLDARLISLDSLQPEDAVRLLDASLRISDQDDDRCVREEQAVTQLATLCDRHPLALHIAVSLLRKTRFRSIASLANELQDTADRTKTLGLRPILDTAYSHLPPDEARLFRLMSYAPKVEVSTDAAVALAGQGVDRIEGLLAELTSFHLVVPVRAKTTVQWRLHDMVKQYGQKTVEDSVSLREEAEAARERLLTYYRRRASEAQGLLGNTGGATTYGSSTPPGSNAAAPTGRNDQTGFTTRDEALAWLDAEWPSLMASIQWCQIPRHAPGAVRLALDLMDHSLNRRRSFDDWITAVTPACKAATQLGEPIFMARLWNSLGSALRQTGQANPAMDAHMRALELYRSDTYRKGEAKALYNIGLTLHDLGKVEEAISHLTKACELHAAVHNHRGEAMALESLGYVEQSARRLTKALNAYTRAAELYRAADDLLGQANAWALIGSLLQEMMEEHEALVAYGKAAQMYHDLEEWHESGRLWLCIARIHDSADDRPQARTHYLQAAEAFTLAGHHDRATECRSYAEAST